MIIQLRNPEALTLQPIRDLFARAFEANKPVTFEAFMSEIVPHFSNPHFAILLGREDNVFKALAIVVSPASQLAPLPQVFYFYNEGSANLRNTLTDAIVEWVKEQGYNGVDVVNWSPGSDKVWARAFRRAGKMENIGSMFRIEF